MASKERLGKAQAKTLRINGSPAAPAQGGQATVTGSLVVATGLKSVASVVASIAQSPASGDTFVTATFSGSNVTLSVWTSADAASTTATLVNWVAVGS